MTRLKTATNLLLVLMLLLTVYPIEIQARPAIEPPEPLRPVVGQALHHDTSPALRDMTPIPIEAAPVPLELPHTFPFPLARQGEPEVDPVVQDWAGPLAMPAPLTSFDGVGNVNGVHPPDTQGDIGYDPATGTKYYVQWVNLSFAIWDVTGTPTQVYGPVNGNTLWQGFGGPCETTNDGDPITLYDPLAHRWLMTQFALPNFPYGPYYECIAVSQTADPTGTWHRYAFLVHNTKMNDYPKFGVWPDGYYMTVNQFTNGASWGGVGVFVFDRSRMLNGQSATFQYFDLYPVNSNFHGLLPSDLDGPNLPPAGAPNYFMDVNDNPDILRLWEFHVDWANPNNTTFGLNGQPNATLSTAAWTELCPYTRNCIPQPGTTVGLDAIADRLMHRLVYRNFGTHEVLVTNHTTDVGSSHAGVRWYEIRDPGGTPAIYQQGTYAPDSEHRWMGSIAMDAMGNMALGYSVSSSSVYPSVRYVGRLASDPLGTLPQAEQPLVTGSGSQTSGYHRWGDYSMMGVDPLDDCTFWYTQEYLIVTGYAPWETRIGSFRFPGCGAAPQGTLTGIVSDASSGVGIMGATVEASPGPGQVFQTTTMSDGSYTLSLDAGTYTVTATAYGYSPHTVSGVTISSGLTTTLNMALSPVAHYVVSGTVTDAQTGWPLYARITVVGNPVAPPAPFDDFWTDPVTGFYSASLAAGSTYTFRANAWTEGYLEASRQIGPLAGNTTLDLALQVDAGVCTAPGYTLHHIGFLETFAATTPPPAWTVIDNAGSGKIWSFDNPGGRSNRTGGAGNFAIVDSDYAGSAAIDTELRTPSFDLSSFPTASLEFKYDFYWFQGGQNEVAEVDLSTDGGSTWTDVWQQSGAGDRGPKTARLDISALATGQPDVRARFHYYNANYEWWWQVDDVFIGDLYCDPQPGGLVVGEVRDANTSQPVAGATVTDEAGHSATARSTADPRVDDAFYVLFAPTGTHVLTATASGYGPDSVTATVAQSDTIRQDFDLPAGLLSADPESLEITLLSETTATHVLTLSNSGGFAADFELYEINAPVVATPVAPGPFAPPGRRISPKHLADPDARFVYGYEPPVVAPLAAGDVIQAWDTGLAAPWGIGLGDPAAQELWVSNIALRRGDDQNYGFQPDGTPTGQAIDTSAWVAAFTADMAYDPFTGRLWQVNVGGNNCLYELDPPTLSATGERVCPAFGTSQRGLAYDPSNDTFYSGSWNDQILYHFDASGTLLDSKDVGLNIAGLAYNPATGHLFASSNANVGYDVYALDAHDNYTLTGGFDIPGLGDFEQAGLGLDCAGHLWAVNQVTGQVIEATSGETDACAWSEIPWLSAAPVSGTVAAGAHQAVTLSFDATGMAASTYPAHLRALNSTPYGPLNLPLTLTVVYHYNAVISPTTATQAGDPGQLAGYSFQVTNTGIETDSFSASLEGNTWLATAPAVVGPLAPGESAPVTVSVTVPLTASCGAHDTVTVTVTSQGNPARAAEAMLTAMANPLYSVNGRVEPADLSGDPGATVSATVYVSNTGNCLDSFELSASGRWPVSVPDPVVEVAAGGVEGVTVTIRIPATALAGDYDTASLFLISSGDGAQMTTLPLTTTANAVYGVSLTPPTDARSGDPGQTVTYTLRLTNTGNANDTLDIGYWIVGFELGVPVTRTTLAVGESAEIPVHVIIPADAPAGARDTVTVTATSQGDPVQSATSRLTTTVNTVYGLALEPSIASQSGDPGQTVTYTLRLTNTGNAISDFGFRIADSSDFGVILPVTLTTLAVGESAEIPVHVIIPADALAGARDTVTVTVTSQGDPVQSATSRLTTTVNTVYGLALEPSIASQSGDPGQTVTYTLRLTNTGNANDILDIGYWILDFGLTAPVTQTTLAAGASVEIPVYVTIPPAALAGARDTVTVTVTSQGDPTKSATSRLTTTANAVYSLTLAPAADSRSGDAGTTVTYTLRLTNAGNSTDSFSLVATGNNWQTRLSVTALGPLVVGESADLEVSVTIPPTADGEDDVAYITATSQNDPSQSATAALTTHAYSGGVDIAPDSAAASGLPGETVTYSLRLTNTGEVENTLALTVSGNTWSVRLSVTETVLAAGAGMDVLASVEIPATVTGSMTDSARIEALYLVGTSLVMGDASMLTTTAYGTGAAIAPHTDARSGAPGETVTYTLRLTNTGELENTIRLVPSLNAWSVSLSFTETVLAAGAGTDVLVAVDIPATATSGVSDTVKIEAQYQREGAFVPGDAAALTTTAVITGYEVYLPVVMRNFIWRDKFSK